MLGLPYSCQFQILKSLDIASLKETRQVSKYLKLLSDSDPVWAMHINDHFEPESIPTSKPAEGYKHFFFNRVKCWSTTLNTDGMESPEGKPRVIRSAGTICNWGTAIVGYPRISKSKQYCEFLVESSLPGYLESTRKIIIGIIPEGFPTAAGRFIGESGSFGFVAQGGKKIGYGGADTQDYASSYGQGDRIGVLVDPENDEISFFKNGKNLGVAFSKFKDPGIEHYHFAVSVCRSNFQIRILPNAQIPVAPYPVNTPQISHPAPFNFDDYPSDIKLVIFSKLNLTDLDQLRLVCRKWNSLASSDYLWAPICKKYVGDTSSITSNNPPLLDINMLLRKETPPLSAEEDSDDETVATDSSASSAVPSSSNTPSPFGRSILTSSCSMPLTVNFRNVFHDNIKRFSKTAQAPGLEISNNGCTVTSTSQVNYWSAIRLEHPRMNSGVHYAEFQIDAFRHGSIGNTWKIVCGIVSDEFEFVLTKWVGVDEKSFGYIAANGKSVGPLRKNLGTDYSETYQENDRIGVLVDFERDEITFYKNGVNLGVAFEEFSKQAKITKPENQNYYFAVSLARWGMKVTSLPGARCPDREVYFQPRH